MKLLKAAFTIFLALLLTGPLFGPAIQARELEAIAIAAGAALATPLLPLAHAVQARDSALALASFLMLSATAGEAAAAVEGYRSLTSGELAGFFMSTALAYASAVLASAAWAAMAAWLWSALKSKAAVFGAIVIAIYRIAEVVLGASAPSATATAIVAASLALWLLAISGALTALIGLQHSAKSS